MKKLLALTILLTVLMVGICNASAESPAIDAGAYILIDSGTGDVLCEKDSDKMMYPASTTKILTAILAIEKGNLDSDKFTASQDAIQALSPDDSNIGIQAGETIPLRNLLQALLISSANETAYIIAENICPTREEFISLMNKRAKELGATNSHFVNPCGVHADDHYTTASDLAKIARYAMTLPAFREIVKTRTYRMPVTNKHSDWPILSNTNKLMINDRSDLYKINGIKTGHTGPAGYSLVSSAIGSDGMELISVVLDVKNEGASENVRKYSKELLDYGFNNFKRVSLIEKNSVYRNVRVKDAIDTSGLDLTISDGLMSVIPKAESIKDIKEIPHISENITAPINKGDVMGYVEYFRGDRSIGRVNLIAARSVQQKPAPVTLPDRVSKVASRPAARIIFVIAGFLMFFILLRITLRNISRKVHSKKRRGH